MRSAVIALSLIGAAAAFLLGVNWLTEHREALAQLEPYRPVIVLDAQLADGLEDMERRLRASYVLLVAGSLGLLGALLATWARPRWATAPLLLGGAIPVFFEPQALIFTSLLLVAGLLALMAPRASPPPASFRRLRAGRPHA